MFCPKCGTQCEDDSVFCGNCGTSLKEAVQTEITEENVATQVAEQAENVQEAAVENTAENSAQLSTEQLSSEQNSSMQNSSMQNSSMQNSSVQHSSVQSSTEQNSSEQEAVKPVTPQPQAQAAPKEKKPMPKWFKILIPAAAAFVVVVAAVIALVSGVISAGDYKKPAENFVKAYAEGDYDKAYKLMNTNVTEAEIAANPTSYAYVNKCANEFLTVDTFRTTRAGNTVMGVKKVKAADISSKNSEKKTVAVTYTTELGTVGYETVILTKKDKAGFLKSKYGVSVDSFVASDVEVRVPVGAKLYINGKEVSEGYIDKDRESKAYSYYIIAKLFSGENMFKITGDGFEDYEMSTYVTTGSSIYFDSSNIIVKQDVIDTVKNQALSDLETIRAAGLAKKDAKEIKSLVSPAYESNVTSDYNYYVVGDLHGTRRTTKAITLTDVKAEAKSTSLYINSDGYQQITIKLSYKFSGNYDYTGYFSSSATNYKGSGSTNSSYITYTLQDGKWGISDLNLEFYLSN